MNLHIEFDIDGVPLWADVEFTEGRDQAPIKSDPSGTTFMEFKTIDDLEVLDFGYDFEVDPQEPNPEFTKEQVLEHIETNRLVEAEVFNG